MERLKECGVGMSADSKGTAAKGYIGAEVNQLFPSRRLVEH